MAYDAGGDFHMITVGPLECFMPLHDHYRVTVIRDELTRHHYSVEAKDKDDAIGAFWQSFYANEWITSADDIIEISHVHVKSNGVMIVSSSDSVQNLNAFNYGRR